MMDNPIDGRYDTGGGLYFRGTGLPVNGQIQSPGPAGDEQTIVDRYSSAVVKYEVKCGELDGAVFRARAGRN